MKTIYTYCMTIFASYPERKIYQFDWSLSGLNLRFWTADSGNNFRNEIKMPVMEQDG